MEIELTDLSGLPDGLKPIVQTVDGKSRLDLSKLMVAEDLTGLKTSLQAEREAARAYAKFGKPDELAKKIADLESLASKGGKVGEDAQAKLDAMDRAHKETIAARDARFDGLLKRNASSELRTALLKAGFIPEAVDDVAATAMGRVKFDQEGNVQIVQADGKPMLGGGAAFSATFEDLAAELAKSKPYAVKDGGTGGTGKPPGSQGQGGATRSMPEAQFNALPAKERASLMAAGLTLT